MNKNQLKHIRSVYRSIAAFETQMQQLYGLNLNEAALLCLLCDCREENKKDTETVGDDVGVDKKEKSLTAGEIAEGLGLSCSNSSKVVSAAERKGLIVRELDAEDKRQMRFSLSKAGQELTERMQCCNLDLPEDLKNL